MGSISLQAVCSTIYSASDYLGSVTCRHSGLPGWIHEYCYGADRGVPFDSQGFRSRNTRARAHSSLGCKRQGMLHQACTSWWSQAWTVQHAIVLQQRMTLTHGVKAHMDACCAAFSVGKLASCMSLQEYVNGQLKNKYGDAFIRGNNGESSKRRVAAGSLDWKLVPRQRVGRQAYQAA